MPAPMNRVRAGYYLHTSFGHRNRRWRLDKRNAGGLRILWRAIRLSLLAGRIAAAAAAV